MKKIYLIGIGMGNIETLSLGAMKAIEGSSLLIGAKRMVETFPDFEGQKHYAIAPETIFDCILEYIEMQPASLDASFGIEPATLSKESETAQGNQIISVVFSGDTGFFSGAKKLNRLLEEKRQELQKLAQYTIEFIPGISSLQYLAAKLKLPWEDTKIISLHGREDNILGAVLNHEKTFFLTGGNSSVQQICQSLVDGGLGEVTVHVGERLSYPEERILMNKAGDLAKMEFDSLSVMLVENKKLLKRRYSTHGLEDGLFIRSKVPMTKSEVRSVSLSKMRLRPEDIIYDIGAGTGAVAMDMAFQAYKGCVYAIEINEEAIKLIEKNREQLGAWNVKVIHGEAPLALQDLPIPDRAFIGGSKGNLDQIIKLLVEKNPRIRVVINAITLETVSEGIRCLAEYGFEEVDIVQISAARSKEVGKYHIFNK